MFDKEQLALIMGMKRAGIKQKYIAKRFKCSINTISRVTRQRKCYSRKSDTWAQNFASQHKFDHLE